MSSGTQALVHRNHGWPGVLTHRARLCYSPVQKASVIEVSSQGVHTGTWEGEELLSLM